MKLLLHAEIEDGTEIFSEELSGDDFYEGLYVNIGMQKGIIKLNPEDERIYYSNTPEGLAMRRDYKRFALTQGEKELIYDGADEDQKAFLDITKVDYAEFSGDNLDDLYSKMDSDSIGCIPDIYNIVSDNIKKIKRYNGKLMFDKIK